MSGVVRKITGYEIRTIPNFSELYRTFANSTEYVNSTSKSPKEQIKGVELRFQNIQDIENRLKFNNDTYKFDSELSRTVPNFRK